MNSPHEERLAAIKSLLSSNPQGLSINEISARLHRHRNSVSRDLHALSLSGQVIQQAFGTTRVYSLSQRTPVNSILHYIPEMVLFLDQYDTIIAANAPLLNYLSCSADALEGKRVHSVNHPLFAALIGHLAGDGCQHESFSPAFRVVLDGRDSFLQVRKIPTVFENGTQGLVLFVRDVSDDVRSRNALETSERQYRAIVDSMTDMVARFLPDGSILFGNRVFSSFFSIPPGIEGQNSFLSLIYPQDLNVFLSHLASLSPEHPSASVSFRVTPPAGSPVWTSWTVQGLYDHNSRALVYQGIGRDITREREIQEREIAHMKGVEFLASKSREFLVIGPDADIYQCISSHILEMIPCSVAAVYQIDPGTGACVLKAIAGGACGGHEMTSGQKSLTEALCSLAGKDCTLAEAQDALLSGALITPGGFLLRQLLLQDAGKNVALNSEIMEMESFSAGLVSEGSLHGAIEVFTRRDQQQRGPVLIDAYLALASLALQRWISQQSLRVSEERFGRVATTNPHPISIIDSSGRYIYLSPRFTELFGYTLGDIPTGREWFMKAFPDLSEQQHARRTWKRDLAGSLPGEIRPRQFRVRCKDGLFKEISFLPVSMSNGHQLVVYEDVTPRVEALQEKNLLFDIFRSSHDGIFCATIDGRILSWNPAAERIYGYSANELEGCDVRMLEPPSRKGEISAILERIRKGEHIVNYETQRLRKDGKVIDVSLTISPVYLKENTIMGASTIIRDITARKSEERLRLAEKQYRDLVDNINVGVYRSTGDPEGRFVWGNTSLLRILGYNTLSDLQGVPVSEMFVHAGGRADLLAELRQQGFVKNREIVLRRADGSTIHVLVTALATFSPEGSISHINGIVEDITGQRLLEQRVAELSGIQGGDGVFIPGHFSDRERPVNPH